LQYKKVLSAPLGKSNYFTVFRGLQVGLTPLPPPLWQCGSVAVRQCGSAAVRQCGPQYPWHWQWHCHSVPLPVLVAVHCHWQWHDSGTGTASGSFFTASLQPATGSDETVQKVAFGQETDGPLGLEARGILKFLAERPARWAPYGQNNFSLRYRTLVEHFSVFLQKWRAKVEVKFLRN
jgi:hypothetical protein